MKPSITAACILNVMFYFLLCECSYNNCHYALCRGTWHDNLNNLRSVFYLMSFYWLPFCRMLSRQPCTFSYIDLKINIFSLTFISFLLFLWLKYTHYYISSNSMGGEGVVTKLLTIIAISKNLIRKLKSLSWQRICAIMLSRLVVIFKKFVGMP
jgi:hypothetical protein